MVCAACGRSLTCRRHWRAAANWPPAKSGQQWGDVVGPSSVTLFAPDAAEHGFERQREIESLDGVIAERQQAVETQEARRRSRRAAEAAKAQVDEARRQPESRQNAPMRCSWKY